MSDYYEGNAGAAPEPGPSEPAADPYAPLNEMGYDPHEAAATRNVLDNIVSARAEQLVEPMRQQLERVQSTFDAQEHEEALLDLEEAYPELQRDDVAGEVLVQAREYVEQQGLDPSLAVDPEVLELVFLRGQAGRRQQQRHGGGPSDDVNDQILGVAPRNNFWGY